MINITVAVFAEGISWFVCVSLPCGFHSDYGCFVVIRTSVNRQGCEKWFLGRQPNFLGLRPNVVTKMYLERSYPCLEHAYPFLKHALPFLEQGTKMEQMTTVCPTDLGLGQAQKVNQIRETVSQNCNPAWVWESKIWVPKRWQEWKICSNMCFWIWLMRKIMAISVWERWQWFCGCLILSHNMEVGNSLIKEKMIMENYPPLAGCHLWHRWSWRHNCIACKWLTLKHNLTWPNLTFKPTTYHLKIYHLQPTNLPPTTYWPLCVSVTPAPPIPHLPPKLAMFRTLPRNPEFQGYWWYFQQFSPSEHPNLFDKNNKPAWNCKTLAGNKLVWSKRSNPHCRSCTNKRTSTVPCSGLRLQKLKHAY